MDGLEPVPVILDVPLVVTQVVSEPLAIAVVPLDVTRDALPAVMNLVPLPRNVSTEKQNAIKDVKQPKNLPTNVEVFAKPI